jgi:outer membrane protein assembly factor BamA
MIRHCLFSVILPMSTALAGELGVIKSVAVRGTNSGVSLATQVGHSYDARVIEQDLRRLWFSGNFDDIRVEATEEDEGTAVVFRVTEAQQLRLHAVLIEPSSYGLRLNLPQGTPMSRLGSNQIALEARKQLRSQGYTDAEVDYELTPVAKRKVDLRLIIKASDPVRVKEIEFAGDPRLDQKDLRGALRALRIRRLFPGVPGIWAGWRILPAYSPEAVDRDLARLESLYLSKGYFDARMRLEEAVVIGKEARVRFLVQSGPLYHVREWTVSGDRVGSPQAFCSAMFAARRDAEREGIIDFSVTLHVQPVANAVADLTARIVHGQPYRTGRIEFVDYARYKDATLRRNFLLDEGAPLDEGLLRKSVARLNRTMLFEPVSDRDVVIRPNEKTGEADISVRLARRRRGAWQLAGPAGPASLAGPLEASIGSRLPPWGSGIFELSTYTASVSMLAFAHPILPALSVAAKMPRLPVFAVRRPFSPGEGWRSGFSVVPQLGWRASAVSYATTQIQQRTLPLLAGNPGLKPELQVAVERPMGEASMFCALPPARFLNWRRGAVLALQILGAVSAF